MQLGDAALYFDPYSADEMASVLERLWMDDGVCVQLAAKGRQKVSSWGPVQFAARLQQIIDDVACRPGTLPHLRGTSPDGQSRVPMSVNSAA